MLTPQEVKSHAFQRASFGGYHMGQVDEFLDVLTEDYTALYNDNAVLKSKMKVLVDKVEEYRATEEAMRKALMTAQRMADELVRDAENRKAVILAEAEEQAKRRTEELEREVEAEEFRLKSAQENTASFVEKMRALYAEQVSFLARLEELAPVAPAETADPVEEAAGEIEDSVQRLLAKAMAEAAAENAKQDAMAEEEQEEEEDLADTAEFPPVTAALLKQRGDEDEEQSKTIRIDLADLQFGRDYEIT